MGKIRYAEDTIVFVVNIKWDSDAQLENSIIDVLKKQLQASSVVTSVGSFMEMEMYGDE